MPTTILLIRHGETAWNRGKIFRGMYDIPLNENGCRQAGCLAQALGSRQIDAAYTSPLSRASETAQIALKPQGIDAAVQTKLRDFDYGQWTGLKDKEVARRWPEEHACWTAAPHKVRPPDGETLQEVFDRAFEMLEGGIYDRNNQTVAVFAHRVVNKLLILGMLTLGLERFAFIRQDNCCVSEFKRMEAGYVMISSNDTGHLRRAEVALMGDDF